MLLSLVLHPLRDHVSDVVIALVLLTLSAAAMARGELLLGLHQDRPAVREAGGTGTGAAGEGRTVGRGAYGELIVQVRDDGVGGADARGSGLAGLRDRVQAAGGTMTLDGPARAGTVLTVRLPVTTEDHLSERAVAHAPSSASRGLRRCRPPSTGLRSAL